MRIRNLQTLQASGRRFRLVMVIYLKSGVQRIGTKWQGKGQIPALVCQGGSPLIQLTTKSLHIHSPTCAVTCHYFAPCNAVASSINCQRHTSGVTYTSSHGSSRDTGKSRYGILASHTRCQRWCILGNDLRCKTSLKDCYD
jgi:hypothetical protein